VVNTAHLLVLLPVDTASNTAAEAMLPRKVDLLVTVDMAHLRLHKDIVPRPPEEVTARRLVGVTVQVVMQADLLLRVGKDRLLVLTHSFGTGSRR